MAAPKGQIDDGVITRVKQSSFAARSIAHAAGVHPNTLANLVAGKTVSRTTLVRISKALDALETTPPALTPHVDSAHWDRTPSAHELIGSAQRLMDGLNKLSLSFTVNPDIIEKDDIIALGKLLSFSASTVDQLNKLKKT
ncbi:MAG: hypothetical protein AAF092_16160 [Pseudomonadota bacterium]